MITSHSIGAAKRAASPPAAADASQAPAPPPATSKPRPRAAWFETVAPYLSALLARPSARLIATGVALLLIGGLLTPNSVWTLPVVIIGAVMVAIGWVGRRLDGRFCVEWGQAGTELEFRARIASSPHQRSTLAQPSSSTEGMPAPATIDSTAHTVELELAELEALIGAAETPAAPTASVRAVQKLRLAQTRRQVDET